MCSKINKAFELLRNDCSTVIFIGFVDKSEIPDSAEIQTLDDNTFNHEYNDTTVNYWDNADFWGNVYLPLNNELYMNFEVHA